MAQSGVYEYIDSLNGSDNIDEELRRQDRYIQHYHLRRYPVHRDGNSLFASIGVAGRLDEDLTELRRVTAEYIAGNLTDFKQFMTPDPSREMPDHTRDIAEKINVIKEDGMWVGYEAVMALSRRLGAVIVVTSGGTSVKDTVRTDSFYFGDEWPEKRIHITWVSAGFYDALLPVPDTQPSDLDTKDGTLIGITESINDNTYIELIHNNGQAQCSVYEVIGEVKRHPSHVCQCKRTCNCQRWHKVHTFLDNVVNTSTESSDTTSSETAQTKPASVNWHEVFTQLCQDAHVLRRWKFVMRWLGLNEASIIDIEHDPNCSVSEMTYNALDRWRHERVGSKATVVVIQEALWKEKLKLAAEGLEKYK